jgi:hypothetical protein
MRERRHEDRRTKPYSLRALEIDLSAHLHEPRWKRISELLGFDGDIDSQGQYINVWQRGCRARPQRPRSKTSIDHDVAASEVPCQIKKRGRWDLVLIIAK